MSCRRINRWVLRNGAEGIPSGWRDHIDSCPRCRALVAQIQTLDGALGETAFPDPGEAYWASFAPGVARRLEAAPTRRRSADQVRRPAWAWVWAPALAAGALAFFIGREVYLSHQTPLLTEKDVPVATKDMEKSAGPTITAAPELKTDHQKSQEQAAAPTASVRPNGVAAGAQPHERAAQLTAPSAQVSGDKPSVSGPTGQPAISEGANSPESRAAAATQSAAGGTPTGTTADSRVWPDRRVTIMGEIAADTEKNTREDDRGLPEQGPHGLSERGYVDGAPSAETVRTLHPPERLEGSQLKAAAGAPNSQSLAEAMRRLDQLDELRPQIATLQAIDPSLRTPAQNRELCALWYRVGILATDRPLIDSALQQLAACLKAADQTESAEWKTKSEQLAEKLAKLPK